MSRSADRAPAGPPPEDDGFSLVEVIVALGVLMLVMVALLPQLVGGIKATGTARVVTQAKGVAQGQVERMRNLPFHISPEAGDFRDVLDTYYRNLTAPSQAPTCKTSGRYTIPQTSSNGYVSATSSARCDYEPTAGPFYRRISVVPAAEAGADFVVVVNTQFISGATPPLAVTPPATYDSQTTAGSQPASRQIGVIITVIYRDGTTVRPVSTYSQISERTVATVRLRAEANATALDVGSATPEDGPVSLSGGQLSLEGGLTYASTVDAQLSGATAALATGSQNSGASATVAVPPTSVARVVSEATGSLAATGCAIACWGGTRVDVPSLSATDGLPQAGSETAPLQSLVTDTANGGISFGNSSLVPYRPELRLSPPLLRVDSSAVPAASGISAGCAAGGSGASSYVTASGYLVTTPVTDAAAPSTVQSCTVARTSSIALFPTEFAPRGVVLVELSQAKASCKVQGLTHTPSVSFDYLAAVSYWNGSTYQSLGTVTPGTSVDPLDAVPLATTPVGGGHVLGDYIASWSSLLETEVTRTEADGVAQVTLPGVLKIASQPVRPDASRPDDLDPTSVVSVTVGALGCLAEDRR